VTHYLLPLTRLNERDQILVHLDAIDCMEPIEPAGSLLTLRGGHFIRVAESVEELKQRLVEAELPE
jgi:hypothetical protein